MMRIKINHSVKGSNNEKERIYRKEKKERDSRFPSVGYCNINIMLDDNNTKFDAL